MIDMDREDIDRAREHYKQELRLLIDYYGEEKHPEKIELVLTVLELLEKLAKLCPCTVLTGVGFSPEETGAAVYRNGQYWRYAHHKEPRNFHGTGDIFASALVGAWHQEKTLEEAVKIAADFTVSCIRKTVDCPAHWYGVKFEAALPELVQKLFLTEL